MLFKLLSRDQFRDAVFSRDSYQCVICKSPAKDAHHIIERRLWENNSGGYYLENGASLCEEHHLEAEQTKISCEQLREIIGITKFPLPEHLYKDQNYTKWGDPILANGMRLKGELFNDLSVQKIIAPMLALYTDRTKYPRTYHLPFSPGITKDDRVQYDLSVLEQADEIIVTIKQDGENTTFYNNYLHARSIEYNPHSSRSWVKALHARIANDIPEGWRVCGENIFARHSIHYHNLEDYFQVFSIWNEKNYCLSWDETIEWAKMIGLNLVPVLWRGKWNEKIIKELYKPTFNGDECEGYVVRVSGSFHYKEFKNHCAKYVRSSHITSENHNWMNKKVEPNKLKG